MTQETLATLNTQTLFGFTEKRGRNAWHYRAELQGEEPNHYTGAVPVADITRRLFNFKFYEATADWKVITDDGVISITDTSRKGIVRSDTLTAPLGIFKLGFQIHDYNEWLVQNVARILDAGLHVGSAGLLRNGGVAYVQVEMEETMESCGVHFRPFLTAATSVDGSLSTTYGTGSQVVECDNTLSTALTSASRRMKIKHSKNSMLRINEAREALDIVFETGEAFAAQLEELNAEYVSEQRWSDFLDAYTAPDPKAKTTRSVTISTAKREALNDLWNNDLRVAPWKNNAYGVLSAVNTYTHHVASARGGNRAVRNMSNAVLGEIDKIDANTLAVLATV